MNKTQLTSTIAEKTGLTKVDARKALDAFIDTVGATLEKGDKVSLIGFGSFDVVKRPARNGRNPQTGKPMKIKAKNVVKFRPGAELSNKCQK